MVLLLLVLAFNRNDVAVSYQESRDVVVCVCDESFYLFSRGTEIGRIDSLVLFSSYGHHGSY